eukprot:1136559-Pelagomonas_calceolata.AAC.2
MAAQQRIKKFVHEHDLRNRPHTLLWLSKVYGNLAGMQERHLCSLRCFRCEEHCHKLARLLSSFLTMLAANSETSRQVLKMD